MATKPEVWFVRTDKGNSAFPVRAEGRRLFRNFTVAMLASGVLGIGLSQAGLKLWWVVFALCAVTSAAWYTLTARRHTDYSMTVSEYQRLHSEAGISSVS